MGGVETGQCEVDEIAGPRRCTSAPLRAPRFHDAGNPELSDPSERPPTAVHKVEMRISLPLDPEGNINAEATGAAAAGGTSASSNPSWFTPRRLLGIFCVINLLNYVDRGVIASNGVNGIGRSCTDSGVCTPGSGIQGDFNLSNFEDGVLSSAFMVGLLVASPIFASLAKIYNPFRLIGVGLFVWTIATAGCGCSLDFWSITIFRMLVGVGEASFISLAAPFIDDNAPVAQKTAWLATFYMCIPAGVAAGYVYGGLVGGNLHWRAAFWIESALMLPFAILGFVMKPLQLKGFTPLSSKTEDVYDKRTDNKLPAESRVQGSEGLPADKAHKECCLLRSIKNTIHEVERFGRDMKALLMEKIFVVNVLGYVAYNFVIGAYSYWGPKAGASIYHMSNADMIFGGITIVCGVLGTLGGGLLLDRMESTISNAFKLLSGVTFFGGISCFGAFCFKSLYGFIPFFSIGEILVFATQAPVNYVCLHSVKPSLRPLSMAISTVSIHIFGDVPSSPLVGILQDRINDWRKSALILTSVFSVAVILWFIGIFLRGVDRFDDESEHNVPAIQRSNLRPLLDENAEMTVQLEEQP